MRTHYGPWQPCWISNQHQKHQSGRGPSNEHFWQVWLKSVQQIQRRIFKCEKLMDAYPWQKLTWSMARWAKNNYLTSRSKSHEGHYHMWHTALWSCTHIPNIIDLSRKKKNVMARTRIHFEVKVPRRSLWYATHQLVVMHPHTKYHWSIWKDKKVMVRTSFAEKKRKKRKQKKKSD